MKDIIYIRNLKIDAIIGVVPWEREVKQTLHLDVEMAVDTSAAAVSDELADALDYAAVATRLSEVVGNSRFQLLEALAEQLVAVLQQEFAVSWLRLRIGKPGAVPAADEVGLIVERGTLR